MSRWWHNASLPRLLAGAGLLVMAGCAPEPAGPCADPVRDAASIPAAPIAVPGTTTEPIQVGRQGVRMIDGAAAFAIVQDVLVGRRPNGAAQVTVRVFNCSPVAIQLEGATQFLGSGGSAAEPPSVWRRLFVPPLTSRDYTEVSTSSRVAAASVEFRSGQ